jgi:hypothetical protein
MTATKVLERIREKLPPLRILPAKESLKRGEVARTAEPAQTVDLGFVPPKAPTIINVPAYVAYSCFFCYFLEFFSVSSCPSTLPFPVILSAKATYHGTLARMCNIMYKSMR